MERLTAHAELQELLGAYALDAVEPEEAVVLELHLLTCPRCRTELTEHREVAALLGYAGGAAPGGVWDRIVAGLEEPPPALTLTRSLPRSIVPTPQEAAPARPVDFDTTSSGWEAKTPPSDAPVVPIGQGQPRTSDGSRSRKVVPMRFMVAIATAAALIVAALGVEVGRLEVHKSQPTTSLEALAYRLADADPGARHLTLKSPDGGYTVQAVIIPDGTTYLGPGNLRVLPSSETYQMWGVEDGSEVSLGVIGDSATYAAFHTPSAASVIAMTVEDGGGVVTTTKTPVVEAVVPNA